MRLRRWMAVLTVMATAACGAAGDDTEHGADAVVSSKHPDLEKLTGAKEILDAVAAEGVRHWPTVAVYMGDRSRDAELEDFGDEETERFLERVRILERKMKTIDPSTLSGNDVAAYDTATSLLYDVEASVEAKTDLWYLSVWDFAENISYITSVQILRNEQDADNLAARYAQLERALSQREELLRRGAREGLVASKPIVERVAKKLAESFCISAADGSPYAQVQFAEGVSDADKAAWQAKIDHVVDTSVVPAVKRYVAFLERELLPKARTSFGYGGLGRLGLDYYETQIVVQTGTTMTSKQVYDLGLRRVAEIETQMKAELDALGIPDGTLSQRLEAVRARPDAQPLTAEETKARGSALIAKLARDAESTWGIPNLPPADIEVLPGSESGYYAYGSNTVTLFTLPFYSNTATITHELTHYMQDVVTRDTEAASPFVKYFGSTALTEGGAHYAEALALEKGLYDTTTTEGHLEKLGALSDLMMRAVRLVVDPGIHAMGWERTRAIQYMRDHVLLDDESIAFEVDRYASYAGQALSYRIGMEAILTERARAQRELGPAFSEAKFHRMVLEATGVSPRVLTRKVDELIAASRR